MSNNDIYYNRVMCPDLVKLIKDKYQWLIDYVITRPDLDFQTGANNNNSWFSIYRGTGKILKIHPNGKVDADTEYVDLMPEFYERPNKRHLSELLTRIGKSSKFYQYYMKPDGTPFEGYYQNLISRRFSLFCKPDDPFVIIDKEFELGYKSKEIKKKYMAGITNKYDKIIKELNGRKGFPKSIEQPGTECDFVALTPQGDVILLELKRHEDTQKIYLSPIQAGKYYDLTRQYMDSYPIEFNDSIIKMVKQKVNLGILKPKFELPDKLSGVLKATVVVGGEPSQTARNNYKIVREKVGLDIPIYKCNKECKIEPITEF